MFETFAPRRGWRERAIGLGLRAQLPNWLDLQLDRADVTAWINAQGIALTSRNARLCHWSFYTRDGALAVYQAILRRRPGWDIASLRAHAVLRGAGAALEPADPAPAGGPARARSRRRSDQRLIRRRRAPSGPPG